MVPSPKMAISAIFGVACLDVTIWTCIKICNGVQLAARCVEVAVRNLSDSTPTKRSWFGALRLTQMKCYYGL
jgi:hypothetical protein